MQKFLLNNQVWNIKFISIYSSYTNFTETSHKFFEAIVNRLECINTKRACCQYHKVVFTRGRDGEKPCATNDHVSHTGYYTYVRISISSRLGLKKKRNVTSENKYSFFDERRNVYCPKLSLIETADVTKTAISLPIFIQFSFSKLLCHVTLQFVKKGEYLKRKVSINFNFRNFRTVLSHVFSAMLHVE